MKIEKFVTITLNQEEQFQLNDLIEGFYHYMLHSDMGESGTPRTHLANELQEALGFGKPKLMKYKAENSKATFVGEDNG